MSTLALEPTSQYLSALLLTLPQFNYLQALFYHNGPPPPIAREEKKELFERNLIEDGTGDHLTRLGAGFVKAMGDILKTLS